ncbi:MAG: VWA domain-containing protein [Leptolyngbya sp. SIOISBB]|nr:VWA domain-containing protein [Leptolyngbya sp. SIOISBB]
MAGNDYGVTVEDGVGDNFFEGGDQNDIVLENSFISSAFFRSGDDILIGNGGQDILYGNRGKDIIFGGAEEDQLHGGFGDDILVGGNNNDFLFGGEGNDKFFGGDGIDIIFGDDGEQDIAYYSEDIENYDFGRTFANLQATAVDHNRGSQADGRDIVDGVEYGFFKNGWINFDDRAIHTKSKEILDNKGFISLELPTQTLDKTAKYELTISNSDNGKSGGGAQFNFAYIIDVSGSMSGADIQEAKNAYIALTNSLKAQGIAQVSRFAVIPFNSDATLAGPLSADEAITAIQGLSAGGGTNFDPPLERASEFYRNLPPADATNVAFFLSDGSGNLTASNAAQLKNLADVRAYAIGNGNVDKLTTIDSDGDVTTLPDASQLSQELLKSTLKKEDIAKVEILVADQVVKTIDPSELVEGALGLSVEGTLEELSLTVDFENQVSAQVVFTDGASGEVDSFVRSALYSYDRPQAPGTAGDDDTVLLPTTLNFDAGDGNDTVVGNGLANEIIGGAGDDTLRGEGGDDVFIPGSGSHRIDGADGYDVVRYDLPSSLYTVSKVGDLVTIQSAAGDIDTLTDIELIGFQDIVLNVDTLEVTAKYENTQPLDNIAKISDNRFAGSSGLFKPARVDISDDGRFTVFSSSDPLTPDEFDYRTNDLFLYDHETDSLRRIALGGTDGYFFGVSVSSDGRFVAFASRANNLVPGDNNGMIDIFVYDALTETTTLASRAVNGQPANNASGGDFVSISDDGRYVAFDSRADNLVPGVSGWHVYVKDLHTGAINLVSYSADNTTPASSSAHKAIISGNGRFVVFESSAPNLVSNDTNRRSDLFIRDLVEGTTKRISVASDGSEAMPSSSIAAIGYSQTAISADGRYVTFSTDAKNLVPDDTNGTTDVFLHDTVLGTTTRVSVKSDGSQVSRHSYGEISADGQFVVLDSYGLIAGQSNPNHNDIYIRELATGKITLAFTNSVGEISNGTTDRILAVSADASVLAIASNATNLTPLTSSGRRENLFIASAETRPQLAISDAQVTEGSNGFAVLEFDVSLQGISDAAITVDYITLDGTANADDYGTIATPMTLRFAPGETRQTIAIAINSDTTFEADETFTVELSNATNALIADGQATGTILNDDVNPSSGIFTFEQYVQFLQIDENLTLTYIPVEYGSVRIDQLFDETYYLNVNADVAAQVAGGLLSSGYEHFVNTGWLEGRNPSSLYNEALYLALNPDVEATILDGTFSSGFEHYITQGHLENRVASELFDPADYLTRNPDVAAAIGSSVTSAFEHYVEIGASEGRLSTLLFEEAHYLQQNPDVVAAISRQEFVSGFEHYVYFGQSEGRSPSALFNENSYLANHSDVAAAISNGELSSGFEHYIFVGRAEGRPVFAG